MPIASCLREFHQSLALLSIIVAPTVIRMGRSLRVKKVGDEYNVDKGSKMGRGLTVIALVAPDSGLCRY